MPEMGGDSAGETGKDDIETLMVHDGMAVKTVRETGRDVWILDGSR